MDAMNVQKLHRVTVLYADSDSELCHAVQLYADGRQEIEDCAIAPDGWKVLQLLEEGFRPQVIVLDSLVSGPTLSHILTQICLLGEQRPYVILTGVPGTQAILQRFLTMGANYIIFKPYTLDDLFAEIYHFCVDDLQWDIYRAKARFLQLLRQMQYNCRLSGLVYLERCVLQLALGRQDYTVKELYHQAVEGEHIPLGAVSSAIERVNKSLRASGPEGYAALCRAVGKPEGGHLTNLELIRSLAAEVRRALR